MKTITISEEQWAKLRTQIVADYGMSSLIISWKLKATLGFIARTHTEWDINHGDSLGTTIRLDFFDESMHTMFLLKYVDYITQTLKG